MAKPKPLRVSCPLRLRRDFIKAAKGGYPREVYAVFMGSITETGISIKDAWYPDDGKKHSDTRSTESIFSHKPWMEEALAIADSAGLVIVSDAHSHPGCRQTHPSEQDWDDTPDGWVHAVCAVWKENGTLVAEMRWWPSIRQVVEKVK